MVGEVTYHQQRRRPQPDYLRMAKAFVNAHIGRLGMRMTQREVEKNLHA
jgi:hypothetical protein